MKSSNLKNKMMILATTLVASSLMVACTGKDTAPAEDLSALRSRCSELSGFTGNADYFPGGVFIWRADDAEVAECEWDGNTVKYLGILGSSHVSDTP